MCPVLEEEAVLIGQFVQELLVVGVQPRPEGEVVGSLHDIYSVDLNAAQPFHGIIDIILRDSVRSLIESLLLKHEPPDHFLGYSHSADHITTGLSSHMYGGF